MIKIYFTYLFTAILLSACASSLFTPTSTPTATYTNAFTFTFTTTSTPTRTFTPSSTVTQTPLPTETFSLPITSIKNRDRFEELVIAGFIKCRGNQEDSSFTVKKFYDEVKAAGVIRLGKYTLGVGVPSTDNPTQCLYLMSFNDGNPIIIYKDSETGKIIQLPVDE